MRIKPFYPIRAGDFNDLAILGGRYLDSTGLPLHPDLAEIQSASPKVRPRTTCPEWCQISSRTIRPGQGQISSRTTRPEWDQTPSRTTFPWWGRTGARTACPREEPRSRPCSAFGWRYLGCAANRWSGTSSALTPWGQFRRRSGTGSIYPGNRYNLNQEKFLFMLQYNCKLVFLFRLWTNKIVFQ